MIRDILVFFGFANFYQRFIKSFNKIARPLTLMLKISSVIKSSKNLLLSIDVTEVPEFGVSIGGDDCKNKMVGRFLFKNLNRVTSYLILNAKQAFTQLS